MKKSSTKSPLISVVITCFNNLATIEAALLSALDQKGNFSVEVVMVDDCSTDGSYEFLQILREKFQFMILQTVGNKGPSAVRNLGITAAKGVYINFLDGDDVLLGGKFTAQLSALENSGADVSYTDCLSENGVDSVLLSTLWPPASGQIYDHLLARNCIAIHAALLKTALAKRYMFDEGLRNAEDYEFWIRLAKHRHTFEYLDHPYCIYHRSKDSLSQPSRKVYLNIVKALKKNYQKDTDLGEINYRSHLFSLSFALSEDYLKDADATHAKLWLNEAASTGKLPVFYQLVHWALNINGSFGLIAYKGQRVLRILKNSFTGNRET